MPMGIGLAVLSSPIVQVIYRDTHPIGPTLLSYLGVASIFVCITLVTNAILQASGNERLPIVSMLVGGVVKILCNLLLVRRPEIHIIGAAIGTVACYAVISVLNCIFIRRSLAAKPNFIRAFLRPLLSSLVMGAAAWAVYGLGSRLLHLGPESGKLLRLVVLGVAILLAVVVYLVMVVVTRSVTREDMQLMPKGEKIARLLHIR